MRGLVGIGLLCLMFVPSVFESAIAPDQHSAASKAKTQSPSLKRRSESARWISIPAKPSEGSLARRRDTAPESPYFQVKSGDAAVDSFPLKRTSVEVQISGVIAGVRVSQTYQNQGLKPIECLYVFPASTSAAVFHMEMIVGNRRIVARIAERNKARKEYEDAKRQGRTASLLEQERPNVFQMSVANILPGDVVRTDLFYTQLLVPERNVYSFVFPTVVGPRYSRQGARPPGPDSNSDEIAEGIPYQHQGEAPSFDFDLAIRVAAGMPIWNLASQTHRIEVNFRDASEAEVRIPETERRSANRDFILNYQLTGNTIKSGILLYKGQDENFFVTMVQPPRAPRAENRVPMEYIFVVDVSGSMHGYPLSVSKTLLKRMLGSLRPSDRFNVVLFSGRSALLNPRSLVASPENLASALALIDSQRGSGGTELLEALEVAMGIPREEKNTGRTLVVATDGFVGFEAEAFDLIRDNLGDANFFAFGIGTSVNRHLIEGIGRVGRGEPFVVTNEEEAPAAVDRFLEYAGNPLLRGITAQFVGFDAYDLDPAELPDVFAERPLVICGKWRGAARGHIVFSGVSAAGPWSESVAVSPPAPAQNHPALRYLWARQRIATLSDYAGLFGETPERVSQITALGLKYNLLTKFTSFVAVDVLARASGPSTVVKQPLPLPEGVSDLAVGDSQKRSETVVRMVPRAFTAPTEIPREISQPMQDSGEYSSVIALGGQSIVGGATGGVPGLAYGGPPGGYVGGVPGGVVGGVLGGVPRSAAPPPPPPPTKRIASVIVVSSLQAAKLIHRVEPVYPRLAKKARVNGAVWLRVEIDEAGNVVKIDVVRGHPLLTQAAIDAVKQWKYQPTVLNGAPIPVVTQVTVNFKL